MNDNTEVIPLDADTREVRYYDAGRPGTYFEMRGHDDKPPGSGIKFGGFHTAIDLEPRERNFP